jgi:hypothetical protein
MLVDLTLSFSFQILPFLAHSFFSFVLSIFDLYKWTKYKCHIWHILGKREGSQVKKLFHCLFHLDSIIIGGGVHSWAWSLEIRFHVMGMFLHFNGYYDYNSRGLLCVLWLVRAHRSWGNFLVKMWNKIWWLERNAMHEMFTIAKENTFIPATFLLFLINC